MAEATVRKIIPITSALTLKNIKKKKALLAVLARAADESKFLGQPGNNHSEAPSRYYTLAQEEMAGLVRGDLEKIENWLGKLDKQHAVWLWCRLSQEKL
jgi:hypothetical protein